MAGPDIDDPDLPLQVLFDQWPMTVSVVRSYRMVCFGCPIAPFHTVVDACLEYAVNEAQFRGELRAAVQAEQTDKGPA